MQLTFIGVFEKHSYYNLVELKGLLIVGPHFLKNAVFLCHDIEHVIHELGFSDDEEKAIAVNDDYLLKRYTDIDLTQWFDHFESEAKHKYCKRFDLIGQSAIVTAEIKNKVALVDVTIY